MSPSTLTSCPIGPMIHFASLLIVLSLRTDIVAAQDPPPNPANTLVAGDQPPRILDPPASRAFIAERAVMVSMQIQFPRDERDPVTEPAVLQALRAVPRHVFVPQSERRRAYADSPLPIGHGQTISQPYIVALMTELLELSPTSKVLEIGTGSGYQAAVLSHITPHVYTVEIIAALAERATQTFKAQSYTEIESRCADGYFGWADHAPYDAIIVTCAAGHLPPPLWEQLKPGGRIVIPIGGPFEVQRLVVITKMPDGSRRSRTTIPVRFVPLTRDATSPPEKGPP